MTLRTIVCTLALMATTAAFAASLAGKPFTYSLKDSLAKGPVVVYFYPSAYTEGCNIQAHEFSTKADRFAAAGATAVRRQWGSESCPPPLAQGGRGDLDDPEPHRDLGHLARLRCTCLFLCSIDVAAG